MPPLRLFGRSWHISSDDLALPGIAGILFHGTWSVLITAQVATIGLPDDCPQRSWASSSILWLLASFVLTTALQVWVTAASLRGGMLEEHKRKNVPTAMYCLLSAYCLEAAALTYTTVVFEGLVGNVDKCYTPEELARTAVPDLAVHRWFIFTTWAMLAVVGGLLVLLYNLYPDRSLDAWVDRVHCLSYVLCCWRSLGAQDRADGSPNTATPTVLRLAKVFGDVFYPLNFSFTDIVAAITLVGITHRSRAHRPGGASHSHALIAAAGAGLFGQGKQQGYEHALAILQTAEAAALGGSGSAALSSAEGRGAAAAAGGFGNQAGGLAAGLGLVGQLQQQDAAAATGMPKSKSHQQLLKLLLDVEHEEGLQHEVTDVSAASSAAGSQTNSQSNKVDRGSGPGAALASMFGMSKQAAATALASSLRRASSDGATAGSSSRMTAPVPRAGSGAGGSIWEQAVRQASAMALAPGYGLNPGSRQGSTAALNLAISASTVRQHSQGSAPQQPSQGVSASRAQSWSGALDLNSKYDSQGSGLETLVSGVAAPSAVPLLSPTGSSSIRGSAAHSCSTATAHAEAPTQDVKGSSSSRLGKQQQQQQQQHNKHKLLGQPQPAAASSSSTSTATTSSWGRPPLPNLQQASMSQAGAAVTAAAVDVEAKLQAAAAAAAGEGSTAGPNLAASADAAEATAGAAAVLSDGSSVDLDLLEEALHWHRYANAIYGWPMFLWSHRYRALRCCRLCCGGCYRCMQRGVELHGRTSSSASLGTEVDGLSEAGAAAEIRSLTAVAQVASAGGGVAAGSKAAQQGSAAAAVAAGSGAGALAEAVEGTCEVDAAAQQATGAAGGAAGLTGVDAGPTISPGSQQRMRGHEGQQQHVQQPQAQQCSQLVGTAPLAANSSASWDVEDGSSSCMGSDSPVAAAPATRTRPGSSTLSRQQLASSSGGADGISSARVQPSFTKPDSAADGSKQGVRGAGIAVGTLRGDSSCCCGGCFGGEWGPSHVPKMEPLTASQRLTREAIVQTARIPEAALLHVNYANLVEGLLPYSVALDEAARCVVLAIRGSLSVEDCVTDVLYDPAPLDEDWLLQPAAAAAATATMHASEAADGAADALPAAAAAAAPLAEPLSVPASTAAAAAAVSKPDQLPASSSLLSRSSSQKASPFATAAAAAAAAAARPADACSSEAAAGSGQAPEATGAAAAAAAGDMQQRPSVPVAQAIAAAAAAKQQDPQLYQQPSSLWHHVSHNEAVAQQQRQELQSAEGSSAAGGGRQLLRPLLSLRRSWKPKAAQPPLLPTTVSSQLPAGSATGNSAASMAGQGSIAARPPSQSGSRPSSRSQLGESFSLNFMPRRSSRSQVSDSQPPGLRQLSQVQRTTAADRALGAARAGHKYAPVTCSATDPAAAAAAADHRSWQQQQQHLAAVPAGERSVSASAAGAAAKLHSINSGAAGQPLPQRAVSVSCAEAIRWQQQQQQQQQQQVPGQQGLEIQGSVSAAAAAGAGLRGSTEAGGWPSSAHHHQLRATWSELGLLGRKQHSQQQQQQQQQQEEQWQHWQQHMHGSFAGYTGGTLQDGGPTDEALLSKACHMQPSSTAAVTHNAASPRAAAAAAVAAADVDEGLHSPFLQYQQSVVDLQPASVPLSQDAEHINTTGAAAAASAADSWLPSLQSCTAQVDDSASVPAPGDIEQGGLCKPGQQLSTDMPQQQQQQQRVEVMASLAAAEAAVAAASAEAEDDAAAAAAQAAAAEETPDTGAAGAQWFAHEGILNCARAIRDDLRSLGLLEQLLLGAQPAQQQQQQHGADSAGGKSMDAAAARSVDAAAADSSRGRAAGTAQAAAAAAGQQTVRELPDCRGWTLVLTGHSLGAGVAALLALHYRSLFPRVRVWCFAPPGGLMSPAAAASLKDICYSLVSAKDMVPRMSLWTIERLRDEMMLCALRCKMPKLKLLLGAALGIDWEEGQVLTPPEELTDAQAGRYRDYRRAVEKERCMDPLRVRIAREFVPPGKIIWLERYKVTKQRLKPPAAAAAAAAATGMARSVPADAQARSLSLPVSSTGGTPAGDFSSAVAAAMEPTAAAAAAAGTAATTAAGMLRAGSRGLAAALAAAPSAMAGKRIVLHLRPHFTDGLSLIVGGMVVSRNMFLDHVPDNQLAQVKRLVRRLKLQRAVRSIALRTGSAADTAAAAAAATSSGRWAGGVSADVPPQQQVMPERQHVVHFAV
uniref:sn-1-specific diacylglycerol lipase n=1 Tax=Tetradesmus obliquus TaxID=3088 RepID=A0A383W0M9_TETOB|eukprot:jgi/Sobl393_1/8746/SZX70699.1